MWRIELQKTFLLCFIVIAVMSNTLQLSAQATRAAATELSLTQSQASHFASLALKCISREYPNKPEHVMNDSHDVDNPKKLHPAFYGSFDWHSSVHGHWMLVRLLRTFPN